MRKALAIYAVSVTLALAGGGAKWSYEGETGPEHWGDLSPEFIMCKLGKNQSPVDLNERYTVKACVKPIEFHYSADVKAVKNTGYSIKALAEGKSYVVVDGKKFYLKQFHFHTPSEHTVNGKYYPMEMHLVHADEEGNLAVIGVFFKVGKQNATLERVLSAAPEQPGKKNALAEPVNPYDLLPEDKSFYRYSGSLTTPPCSEGVRWFVMREPLELSQEQLARFQELMGKNNRPVQPINARKILK
ncbi:MAG: carbonic anhydrase family protein [Aquificae bacterium]|nr:carbonic anhydrase family protein [Aquificota bacterium]